jgi:hypothetical protein
MRGWETAVAIAAAGVAGWLAPADLYRESSAEIVAAIGFVMAALVPAMVLSATALRAGNFSPLALQRLHAELSRQISLFGGLFLYCLATVSLVLIGKSLQWGATLGVWMPDWWPGSLGFGRVIVTFVTFGVVFVALRSATLVTGIGSILRLSADLAISEAVIRAESDKPISSVASYKMPENYGARIDQPH